MTNYGLNPLNWNTGNVQTMQGMFAGAVAFNQNISGWDTNKLKSVRMMFYKAEAFNQDISGWRTPSLEYQAGMFDVKKILRMGREKDNVEKLEISGWDAKKLKDWDWTFNEGLELSLLKMDVEEGEIS